MERLSDRAIEIINELHTERLDYESEYLPLIDCANKCKEYEDTGLDPEEIKVLQEFHGFHTAEDVMASRRVIELAQADMEGRCVVLPCKKGDKLNLNGTEFSADHWNILLSAFAYGQNTKSGKKVELLTVQESEAALRREQDG